MSATATRADWVGRTIDGRFRLLEYLGGSKSTSVFLTDFDEQPPHKVAIKLIPVTDANPQDVITRWEAVQRLRHGHVAELLAFGRCRIDVGHYLYVVTEYADELLSQIIPDRPLTPDETTDMLAPVLDALEFIHAAGFVHGDLRPPNILVVGEQLKISADSLIPRGTLRHGTPEDIHEAPESSTAGASPAQDIWSLGVTLVESLTQQPPGWDKASQPRPQIPANLPEPFGAIADACLEPDPERRCTLAGIWGLIEDKAKHEGHVSPTVPDPVPEPIAATPTPEPVPVPVVAPAQTAPPLPLPPPSQPPIVMTEPPSPLSPRASRAEEPRKLPLIPALVGLFVLVGAVVAMQFRHHSTPPPAPSQAAQSAPAASAPAPQPAQEKPSAASTPAPSAADPGSSSSGAGSAPTSAPATPAPNPPAEPLHVSQGPVEKGGVLEKVMPPIPAKAIATIQGTVKLTVKVMVDETGTVSDATLSSPGPSRYFANFALESARSWKFRPAQSGGKATPSVWLLHYRLRRSGIEVDPEEQNP